MIVNYVEGHKVSLTDNGGRPEEYTLTARTPVTIDGARAYVSQLENGWECDLRLDRHGRVVGLDARRPGER